MIKWLKDDLGLKFQNQKSSLINWAGQAINDFRLWLYRTNVFKIDSLYCFLFTPAAQKQNGLTIISKNQPLPTIVFINSIWAI